MSVGQEKKKITPVFASDIEERLLVQSCPEKEETGKELAFWVDQASHRSLEDGQDSRDAQSQQSTGRSAFERDADPVWTEYCCRKISAQAQPGSPLSEQYFRNLSFVSFFVLDIQLLSAGNTLWKTKAGSVTHYTGVSSTIEVIGWFLFNNNMLW